MDDRERLIKRIGRAVKRHGDGVDASECELILQSYAQAVRERRADEYDTIAVEDIELPE